MTAPSKNFTPVTDAQIDADSPLDTTLFTSLRDSQVNLKEWLGNSYAAAVDHGHNGIDSKKVNDADIIKTNAVAFFDDFLDPNVSPWYKTATIALQSAANGWCRITNATSSGVFDGMFQSGQPWKLTAGITVTVEMKIKPVTTGTYDFHVGLMDSNNGWANIISFARINGSANWRCCTMLAGALSNADGGIAITDGTTYTLKIVATASAILFYIDGALRVTATTNIPTINLGLAVAVNQSRVVDVDYINCSSSGRM